MGLRELYDSIANLQEMLRIGYGIIKWTPRKENLVKGDLLYDQKKLRQRI